MGISCGKVMCNIDNGDGTGRTGRRNQAETSKNWQKHFTVDLECYCVPIDRVLTRDINTLSGPGAECRTVAVTTIHVGRKVASTPQNRLSALNSVVYSPVLQWFGIDVREQVPKYLPMNLWTGSHSVFGFYKPEEASSAYVTLTAKIGAEDLFLEEELNTKKSLSAEQWSNITRGLEKELAKLPSKISIVDKVTTVEEKTVDEERAQRASQDTGYMSRRITPNQSPFSYKYMDLTSDSEDATSKEKQIKEKKLRMRRKDTPAVNAHPVQFVSNYSKIRLRESPLAEEADSPGSPSGNFTTRRSLSSHELDATTDDKVHDESNKDVLSTPSALGTSKSYQDIPNILSSEPLCDSSAQAPDFETSSLKSPSVHRKKKRSIANKIGEMTSPVLKDSHDDRKEHHRHSDIGSEADDEESILTDSDKLSKRMPLPEVDKTDEEMMSFSPKKVAEAEKSNSTSEKPDSELDQTNDQHEDNEDNIAAIKAGKGKSECELVRTGEEHKDTREVKHNMAQTTELSNTGITEQPIEGSSIKPSISTKTSEPNEMVSNKNKTLTNVTDSKAQKENSMEKKELKMHAKMQKKLPVRTDSSSVIIRRSLSRPEKRMDNSLKRTSKSISFSSKAAYTAESKKQLIEQTVLLETDPAPPTTPKEAFSDTN